MTTGARADARKAVAAALTEADLDWEQPEPNTFVVTLPGTRKLATTCSLVVGGHTLSINAFVARQPDENHRAVYQWLLEHNVRGYGVYYALDALGDVYLVGKVPLHAVTANEVDRLLGAVLERADDSFDQLLELGFATAIRREWAWRVKRGESLANLSAFRHFAEPGAGTGAQDGDG